MKKLLPTIILLCLCVFAQAQTTAQQKHLDSLWLNVQRYQVNDLPASALEEVNAIFKLTEKEKLPKQWYKALLYKAQFTLLLGDDKTQFEVINDFKMAIADTDEPMKAILQSLLAEAYIEYYKANRYTINKRTEVVGNALPEDMAIWGKQHFMAEIILLFQASVSNEELLQQTAIADYQELLVPVEIETLRPTLFDFLAFRAVRYYIRYNHLLPQHFTSETGYPAYLLRENKVFLNSGYPQQDSLSFFNKTIQLYRDLTRFHIDDDDKTALLDITLKRLAYVRKQLNSNEDDVYLHTMAYIKDKYKKYPSVTDVHYALATAYYSKGNKDKKVLQKVLRICQEAIDSYPNTIGAENCRWLRSFILERNISLQLEENLMPDKPAYARINFKNTDTVYIKIFKVNYKTMDKWFYSRGFKSFYREDYGKPLDKEKVTKLEFPEFKNLIQEWTQKLPDPYDYQSHSTEVVIPAMPQGHYVIMASINSDLKNRDEVTFKFIDVNPLALLENNSWDVSTAGKELVIRDKTDTQVYLQLFNRETGKPMKNQPVKATYFDADTLMVADEQKTDKLGAVVFSGNKVDLKKLLMYDKGGFSDNISRFVTTTVAKDTFTIHSDYLRIQDIFRAPEKVVPRVEKYSINTHLFTDRTIYRPGQSVQFKAILTKWFKDKTTPFTNEYVDVICKDANYKEFSRVTLQLNEFGSVAGVISLPKSGNTGKYSLTVVKNDNNPSSFYENEKFSFNSSSIRFSVEEYKRPKFEATFKPITESYKINDSIRLQGEAAAFAGSKITNAKVSYTVKRALEMPWWYSKWYSSSSDYEMATGETTTNAQGKFVIPFKAIPDEDYKPDVQPVFVYKVEVWVTDGNGETQSAETTVRVGYHSIQATLNVASEQQTNAPVEITVTTKNLNGEVVDATGVISVYKNRVSENPKRKRPWTAPDLPLLSGEQFNRLFPFDWYKEETKNTNWDSISPVVTIPFDTGKETEYQLADVSKYVTGGYTLIARVNDESGKVVKAKGEFQLKNPKVKEVYDAELFTLTADRTEYEKGDKVSFSLGTAAHGLYVNYTIYKDNIPIESKVIHLNKEVKKISVNTDEDAELGYGISCHYVWQNSYGWQSAKIKIAEPKIETLTITTGVFRDKLQPGTEEIWSFTISGMENDNDIAEVLTGMYDASLDKFLDKYDTKQWSPNFNELLPFKRGYYIFTGLVSDHFSASGSSQSKPVLNYIRYLKRTYGELNTYGLNVDRQRYAYNQQLNKVRAYLNASAEGTPAANISGKVINWLGLPLYKAKVSVAFTNRSTLTDGEGKFTLKAAPNEWLLVSYPGMETQELQASGLKSEIKLDYHWQFLDLEEEYELIEDDESSDFNYYRGNMYSVPNRAFRDGDAESTRLYNRFDSLASGVSLESVEGNQEFMTSFLFEKLKQDALEGNKTLIIDSKLATQEVLKDLNADDVYRFELITSESAKASYGVDAPDGAVVIVTQEGQAALEAQMANVKARTDLKETAFFFPQLTTNNKGEVTFTFTSPEALTQWKLQLLAHTKDLRIGYKQLTAVTQKELMVLPNLPRFVREGDTITISTKISNLTTEAKTGNVQLVLFNPVTGEELKDMVVANQTSQPFTAEAQGNTTASWQLAIPEGLSALQCKIVAVSGAFSDGEQSVLPVLKNKILVTESVAVTIAGTGEKTVTLDKLKNNTSKTLQHHVLTLEVTDNAVWYAVQALPYLMEFPYECAEQTFSRLYANLLAGEIVNQHPKIKEVFEKWKAQGELQSKLEQNEELKNVLLQESPWVRDAQSEAEQQQRIALLFDLAKLKTQTTENLLKLDEMQLYDGGFPWFQGGKYPSRYITQHIIEGMAELNKLGLLEGETLTDIYHNGLKYLTSAVVNDFDNLNNQLEQEAVKSKKTKKQLLSKKHLSVMQLRYLYARSFFPEDSLKTEASKAAYDYYYGQATQYWTGASLYEKGLTALVLFRNGDTATANKILKSITEYATTKDGIMYWNANTGSYAQTAIENHAFLISVYKEIAPDNANIPLLKAWLLQHKTLHSWQTTKATAKAIYALLETEELPTETAVVTISLGGKIIALDAQQAGTGYYKKVWTGDEVTKAGSELTLTSAKSKGLATAALHWQYFEDANEITKAGKGISVTKSLYIKQLSGNKETWVPVENHRINVGDIVKVRLILKTDKDISYVHLKDMRAAGMEPVDVLPEYKYQDGLYYYQSTRDAATNFFFEEMAKGTYVFEYDVKANNEGVFSAGICTLQSMYAPEVNAHSNGLQVVISPQN